MRTMRTVPGSHRVARLIAAVLIGLPAVGACTQWTPVESVPPLPEASTIRVRLTSGGAFQIKRPRLEGDSVLVGYQSGRERRVLLADVARIEVPNFSEADTAGTVAGAMVVVYAVGAAMMFGLILAGAAAVSGG